MLTTLASHVRLPKDDPLLSYHVFFRDAPRESHPGSFGLTMSFPRHSPCRVPNSADEIEK